MSSLSAFLEFWHEPPQWATPDPLRRLYHAFVAVDEDLRELKSQAWEFILPGKDSRGRWMPVFDGDRTDEISLLASHIDAARDRLKSISNDIEQLFALAGGPSQMALNREREELARTIANAAQGAARSAEREQRQHKDMRPSQIEALPRVSIAYAALDKAKSENTPLIEAIDAKLSQIREITEKYS